MAAVVLGVLLAACGPGDGAVTEMPEGSGSAPAVSSPVPAPKVADADARVDGLHRSTTTNASSLERTGVETATSLERRVAETLNRLESTVRDGDTVVTLPDTVLFDFDRDELRPDAAGVLDSLAEVMTFYDGVPVKVEGHTDSVGTAGYNQRLSERRAAAVASYLLGRGVDPDRISAAGFGAAHPVAPNAHPDGSDNPAGRAANRRVEIVLVGVD
jgi:outer membrane protein OmpA-like peptidoglycan-associated protein